MSENGSFSSRDSDKENKKRKATNLLNPESDDNKENKKHKGPPRESEDSTTLKPLAATSHDTLEPEPAQATNTSSLRELNNRRPKPARKRENSLSETQDFKMRLRRRHRALETELKLGSDGASSSGSLDELPEEKMRTPDYALKGIESLRGRGEKSKDASKDGRDSPKESRDASSKETDDDAISEASTVKPEDDAVFSDEDDDVSTAVETADTSADSVTAVNADAMTAIAAGGSVITRMMLRSALEAQPVASNSRKRRRIQPSAMKRMRVVDCGIRSDGTVCRCISIPRCERGQRATARMRTMPQNPVNRLPLRIPEMNLDLAYVSSTYDSDSDSNPEDDGSVISSDSAYGHGTTSEDIDADLAVNTPATSRLHRCQDTCPIGCRGNQRPSEIIIFESKCNKRIIKPGVEVSIENPVNVFFRPTHFKRVGGRGIKSTRSKASSSRATSWNQNGGLPEPEAMPQRVAVLLEKPPVSRQEALKHAWNPQDRSFNVRLSEQDPFTIRRQPVAQSTDSARTLTGYSTGLHVMEVTWPIKQRGTHAVVGVATDKQILHSVGYSSLIGLSDQSWGWDLKRLKAFHNSMQVQGTDYPAVREKDFNVNESFHLVLDCDAGTLAFAQAGKWLGISHSNLKGQTLYPAMSSVWGHAEVTLKYHGSMARGEVPKLMDLSRICIKRACSDVASLPIPQCLKNFLTNNKNSDP